MSDRLISRIVKSLEIPVAAVVATLELLAEGATVPFIARYRKEKTGGLNEIEIRDIAESHAYLVDLEGRKKTILETIEQIGKLTAELRSRIENCWVKSELEDLYLPYKPKRRTRATQAKEKGLEPLAAAIESFAAQTQGKFDFTEAAAPYVNAELGVKDVKEALAGAADILAERLADRADLRQYVRSILEGEGVLTARLKDATATEKTKFDNYGDFQRRISQIAAHNLLGILRGETESVLVVKLEFDRDKICDYLFDRANRNRQREVVTFYRELVADAFDRLFANSLTNEVLNAAKAKADRESIETFAANLRELLLAAPAGMKPTLGIDPGFRTGCKIAALSPTGEFLEYRAIFPHQSDRQRQEAAKTLLELIAKHKIELIAIGNGTAGRETDEFVREVITKIDRKIVKVTVSEAGASVYSASDIAIAEFPDLDITIRGAICIGRRLQDPLAELVKIDPKSIGVGQYQHDVEQKLLKQKLHETVESCVNYVGVDVNSASAELLTYVSGLNATVANNIVNYRRDNGIFTNRSQLKKVAKLGNKAYEQAAGFLRIRDGENPLDNTAVHPESYSLIKTLAKDLHIPLTEPTNLAAKLQKTPLDRYITPTIGEPTLRDIIAELAKPGRDPRAEFTYATFQEGIDTIADLKIGMKVEGCVTNVANFGAFVDIGVHQDGLIHISQLSDRFITDPKEVVKVGQIVKVKVIDIDIPLKRISLSIEQL
jgi:protein Tex